MLQEDKDFHIPDLVERYERSLSDGHPGYFDVDELEEISDFYQKRGRNKDSSEVVEMGLRLHPNSSILLLKRATLYLEVGEARRALQIIDRLPERDDTEANLVRAEILMQLNRREESLLLLHKVMDEEHSDRSLLSLDISSILVEAGMHNEAIGFLTDALRNDENSIDLLFELAYSYEQVSNTEKAIQTYHRILDVNPYSSETWFNLGQACFNENRYTEAIEAYDFALVVNPDDLLAQLQKAHSLFQSGQYLLAASAYNEYGLNSEVTCAVLVYEGESYEKAGLFDQAMACYQKALDINPKSVDACTGMGICLMEKEEFRASLVWFEKALRIDHTISETWVYVAEVFVNLEMPEEAMMSYKRSLDIDPDQADVLASLGNLHFDAGQYENALAYYQEAELLDPELNGLDLFYALVYAKTGAREVARDYLYKAILTDENAQKVFDEIMNEEDNDSSENLKQT
ncbi:MAG: tetratricopeptide repeat protein [Bacteroidales bacterium]|nr:tetratricopeptide repeat protein [Bacteroidales bacterium]